MKKQLLKEIIEKKEKKIEFAIVTNLENGENCIFEKNKPIDKNFEKYKDKIDFFFILFKIFIYGFIFFKNTTLAIFKISNYCKFSFSFFFFNNFFEQLFFHFLFPNFF